MPLNDYFNFTTPLSPHTLGRETAINDLFTAVAAGFSLIPSTAAFTNNLNGYYTDTSIAVNAILLTPSPILGAYTEGALVRWKQKIANTGPCTLNISALGPINLKRNDGSALIAGDMPIDSMPVAIIGAAGAIAYLVSSSAVDVTAAASSAAAAAASASSASTSASSASASLAACNALFAITATPQFAKLGLGMAPANILDITQSQNATSNISIVNSNAGASASCRYIASNGTSTGTFEQMGTGYTPVDIHRANGTLLNASGAGGLTLNAASLGVFIAVGSIQVASFSSLGLTVSGKVFVGSGPNGVLASTTNANLAAAGTLDLDLVTGGASFAGIVEVSSIRVADANFNTGTVFAVEGRAATLNQATLITGTGAGASTFSLTMPSNGVLRVTNTSGNAAIVTTTFSGHVT